MLNGFYLWRGLRTLTQASFPSCCLSAPSAPAAVSTPVFGLNPAPCGPSGRGDRRQVCIQIFAHGLRELESLKRLRKKVDAFRQRKILGGDFRAVTARVNHLQAGLLLQEPFGQLPAI